MRSRSITVQRQPLQAGVKLPIKPDRYATGCTIQNGTQDVLQVHSTDEDDLHFLTIDPGFERALPKLHENGTAYSDQLTAFWLTAAQDGTVILIWT